MSNEWKSKYLDSLDNLERKERAWGRLEELLRLAMNRVSLAADGVDARLDKQLESLRRLLRKGDEYQGLDALVEDISRTVKRLDEERQQQRDQGLKNPGELLLPFMDGVQFPKEMKASVKSLRKSLSAVNNVNQLTPQVKQLAQLVNQSLQAVAPQVTGDKSEATPGSLFGGLFNKDNPKDKHNDALDKTAKQEAVVNTVDEAGLRRQLQETLFLQLRQQVTQLIERLSPGKPGTRQTVQEMGKAKDASELLSIVEQFVSRLISSDDQSPETNMDSSAVERDEAEQTSSHGKQDANQAPEQPEPDLALGLDEALEKNKAVSEKLQPMAVSSRKGDAGDWSQEQKKLLSGFCLSLLESLSFPKELAPQVEQLRQTTLYGVDNANTGELINRLADLITSSRLILEQEKNELQNFLKHLTEHLKEIDQQLLGAESQRKASVIANRQLDDAVREEVMEIENSFNDADGLDQLKALIQTRLMTIRNHFDVNRKLEEQYQKHMEQALADSNARLKMLEKEGDQLRQRLKQQRHKATHDALTGVYNRLAFEERIKLEYARWRRYRQPLVLMIVDIDFFKKINDSWGHKAGDNALCLIATILQKNIRESDFLGRFGGEEFVLLLPETDLKSALLVANKLRKAVESCHFHYQEKPVTITISTGVTEFSGEDSIESAFQRADRALYEAKNQGRNRCEAA